MQVDRGVQADLLDEVLSDGDRQLVLLKRILAVIVFAGVLLGDVTLHADTEDGGTSAVCVENGGNEDLLFVAEADGGERKVRALGRGETLCASAPKSGGIGTVGVFENENAIEGCSRLAIAGMPERLIGYVAFDNCTWENP